MNKAVKIGLIGLAVIGTGVVVYYATRPNLPELPKVEEEIEEIPQELSDKLKAINGGLKSIKENIISPAGISTVQQKVNESIRSLSIMSGKAGYKLQQTSDGYYEIIKQ